MKIVQKSEADLRHIIDVNGQLFGVGPSTISTSVLRALASVEGDMVQVFDRHEYRLSANQTIRLSEDEVLFFRSTDRAMTEVRLAA